MRPIILIIIFSLFLPSAVHAYIGPGLGAGVIGVVLGLITSLLLAIMAIFWYPIKNLIRKFRRHGKNGQMASERNPAKPSTCKGGPKT